MRLGRALVIIVVVAAVLIAVGLAIPGPPPRRPSPPRHLSATAGPGTVTLAWRTPRSDGGAPVTRYRASDGAGHGCVTRRARRCTIVGLEGGVSYAFRVVAVNSVGASAPSARATATPTIPPASLLLSRPLTYAASTAQGYGGVVALGTPVTAAELRAFGPANPSDVVCSGEHCVGLATVDGFQYPVESTDAARTWVNAGHWFAGPWADGAAFATSITMLSASTWFATPGYNAIYLTTDGGADWYSVYLTGNLKGVVLDGGRVTVSVAEPAIATFASSTGASWVRVSTAVKG